MIKFHLKIIPFKILSHELGHNFGMSHDFDDKHENIPYKSLKRSMLVLGKENCDKKIENEKLITFKINIMSTLFLTISQPLRP